MRHNKKAQVYPIFVAIFTVFALTYALVSLNSARKITDINGKNLMIGDKQAAVFASLQSADGINIFIDQASEIAAQKAIDKISASCFVNPSTEHVVDEWVSPCGKYVYPMWSNEEKLCLPDCETAFANAFEESFFGITPYYYKVTGIELPLSYNFTVEKEDEYFLFHGISSSETAFTLFSTEAGRFINPVIMSIPYEGGKFVWPVQTSQKIVSSCFGARILDGKWDQHPAIDIAADKGTPVLAAAYGQVVIVNECYGRVVISHGSGISSEYLHMDTVTVKIDETVNKGQQVGTVGRKDDKCAETYPPHLHFAVMYKGVPSGLKFGTDNIVLTSFGTEDRVQPLCFLETPDAKQGSGCDSAINTQLDQVCAQYGFPQPSTSPITGGLKSLAATYDKYKDLISDASLQTGVSECQILAQIYVESTGNPNAVSPRGAGGLVQLMPDTARDLGLNVPYCDWVNSPNVCDKGADDRFNPEKNVAAGARYIKWVRDRINNRCNTNFAFDSQQVLAGYNWGPNRPQLCAGALETYDHEAQTYVERVTAYMQACKADSAITGRAISSSDSSSTSSSFGTYIFKPSFTVKVNKEFNDSVKPLADWFKNTWENCIDNPKSCINDKMKEFNSQKLDYTLSFADRCEKYPVFYDMMELIEDCFSNKTSDCVCEFNFSKASSPTGKDLAIVFDPNENTASLYVKEIEGFKKVGESYKFYSGTIKPGIASHMFYTYLMNFNPDTHMLESARLSPMAASDDSAATTYVFDDYKVMRIMKTSPNEGVFSNAETTSKCFYAKDKFRLCATPIAGKDSLIPLKFALKLKDKPPEPVVKEEVVVTPLSKDNSVVSSGIADQILSTIPGLGVIGIFDDFSSVANEQEAGLQVAMKVPTDKDGKPADIAGYKIYCNDYLTDFLEREFLDNFNPNEFVVMASSQLGQVSQLDKYVNTNPYTDFLSKKDCHVPVTKPSTGETVSIPAIKGVYQNGTLIFNIKKCGAASVVLDKFIRKDYCVTLIPVDKNGNEMKERAVSNCAKTNSIMDLVVSDLIKQELGSFIPSGLIPDSLQPYLKLPNSNQIFDAVTGKTDFNLVSIINTENLDPLLQGIMPEFISNITNKQITTNALISTIEGKNMWEKQEVYNMVAGQISNDDAQMLFSKVISGGDMTDAATSMAYEKGIDYMSQSNLLDQSKASEILRQTINGDNVQSLAYGEIMRAANEQLDAYDQKEHLLDVAKSGSGADVRSKIIEKAVNKGCADSYGTDVDEAAACLTSYEIKELYSEVLSDYQTSDSSKQALLGKAVDRLDAPTVLKNVMVQGDLNSVAYELAQSELNNMPDWAKSQFVTDILRGGMIDSGTLQTELFKMIPSIDNSIIPNILADGNINSLLGDSLRTALESEVNSFVQGECTPATG